MIFYVYGSHLEYENIIRRTRERTTAEILMQTDHATADANHTEETDPAKLFPSGQIWNSFMNYRFLPETAKKYGCGLVDQRNLWKKYLTGPSTAGTETVARRRPPERPRQLPDGRTGQGLLGPA